MEPDRQPPEPPVVNILGERVALGPWRRDLLPLSHRWRNDFQAVRTLDGVPEPVAAEASAATFDRAVAAEDAVRFFIYERSTWRPVGATNLHGIDVRQGTTDFGLFMGEPDYRGRGYGTETTRLMLDYAFTALGLHNVMLEVYEFNLAALRVYAKAGFREVGRRRQARWMGGRRWDVILMDCPASEFTSPVLARIFAPEEPRG